MGGGIVWRSGRGSYSIFGLGRDMGFLGLFFSYNVERRLERVLVEG